MITKIEPVELPGFYAAGLTVRTINANGQSMQDIGALWTRVISGNVLHQINDRTDDDIYCFYYDYESDHAGYYTALLGCKIKSLDHLPEDFSGIFIPTGKYHVYSLAGKFPENVGQVWQEIWGSDVTRAYTFDFDLYGGNAKSFEETEVKICVAVK